MISLNSQPLNLTNLQNQSVRQYVSTHTAHHIKTTKPLGSHMRVHNPRKQVFAWIVPKPSLICRRIGKQRAKDMFLKKRKSDDCETSAFNVCVSSLCVPFKKKKKNLFHATYKRITVRRFETNRANSSDVTTVSLCMSGVQRNKDMIACGRCPAPLPLQKPRDITASCIDVSLSLSLTCE